jgi:hypothetical protein
MREVCITLRCLHLRVTAANGAATVIGVENVAVDWNDLEGQSNGKHRRIAIAALIHLGAGQAGAIGDASFVATNVRNSTITVSSSKFGYTGNALVTNGGSNTVVASTGVTGEIAVSGITTSVIDAGVATSAEVDGAGTTGTLDTATLTINKATFTVDNDASVDELTLKATVASTVTLDSITDKLTVAGSSSMTIKSAAFTTETVTKSLTGGATLTVDSTGAGAAVNFTNVQADTYKITGAPGANAVTVATGSNVYVNVDLGHATSSIASAAATASTNTVNLTVDKGQTGLVLTNIATANIANTATAASGAASTIDLTYAVLDAGTNKVVMTGTNDVKVTAGTAKTFDASGLTGSSSRSINALRSCWATHSAVGL